MARIENHKFTIEQAFRECFYIVPDYQREYVWIEEHVNRLLEDINEQIDASSSPSSEYFIGTVLVSPTAEKQHFDVIDGQQRLTTIFLILCALRVLSKDTEHGEQINGLITTRYTNYQGNVKTNFKLEPRYENAGKVIEKIVQENDDPPAVKAGIQNSGILIYGSVKNILDAYDVIYRFLTDNYDDETKLKKYWGHLANNVVFIQISTEVSNALKIFETINERGVGLNPMDLLKNLLFTQVDLAEFSRLKDEWKKVTNHLEKNEEKPLRFLRYFLMANYEIKNDRNDATLREDEIYDWLSKKENAGLTGYQKDPFEFVRQITRNVERYIDFSKGLGNDNEQNFNMESLKKLTGGAFSMHYVLLLAAANLPKSLFDQFVSHLESFLFYYIFTKTPTKDLEPKFSIWADKIRDISKKESREEQLEELNTFTEQFFAKNMDEKTPELNDKLKRLALYSMQKYRIHYLLSRLTQYVDMAHKGQKSRGSLELYSTLQIEHIMPTTPKDDLRNSWKEKYPDTEYDEIINRLGNLTLLEKPININAGNNLYSDKVSKYANSANYLTRSLAKLDDAGQNTSITRINEKLLSFDKWDVESIEERQSMLIVLAKDVWKISEIK